MNLDHGSSRTSERYVLHKAVNLGSKRLGLADETRQSSLGAKVHAQVKDVNANRVCRFRFVLPSARRANIITPITPLLRALTAFIPLTHHIHQPASQPAAFTEMSSLILRPVRLGEVSRTEQEEKADDEGEEKRRRV